MFGHPTFGFPHLGGGGTVVAGVNTFRTTAPGFTPTLATAGDVVLAGGGTVPVDGIQTGVKQLINTDTTNFPTGDTRAWVESVQAFFHLKISARAVDNITVVTPLGGPAGRQWVREQVPIMLTPIRNAWAVDTGAGNDENEGWLMGFVYDHSRDASSLLILDAQDIEGEAVARINLPRRVPQGFHGNWLAEDRLGGAREQSQD
jgi:hypothetical protein